MPRLLLIAVGGASLLGALFAAAVFVWLGGIGVLAVWSRVQLRRRRVRPTQLPGHELAQGVFLLLTWPVSFRRAVAWSRESEPLSDEQI